MNAPVFISHSSRDKAVAETICDTLERRGIECWISSRDIAAGANFQESIVQAVRSARVMVLVFTSNANNSNEIKKELALASRHGLSVIPVRVEDVLPGDAFSYEFATRQWIDAFGDWDAAVGRLAEHVRLALGEPAPDRPAGDPAGRRGGPRNRPPFALVAASVGAVVVIAVAAFLVTRHQGVPPQAKAPIPPGRLGHYSAADGLGGFVLDRSGADPLLRFDGSADILRLTPTPAPLGDVALRRSDGYVVLRIDSAGAITVFDEAHDDGVAARRDADAPPLSPPEP
jgi:hypothetical protein